MATGKRCLYNRSHSLSTPAAVFRILAPSHYRRMPWKNGGGFTEEIVAYPERAALGGFDWRVSIAEVARDGPFSRFPGIDRTIALIEGAGMRLSHGDVHVVLRTRFEPYAFDGDHPVDCKLVSGPVRDFNAMVRRDRARGEVAAIRAGASIAAADFRIVFAAIGAFECAQGGETPIDIAQQHTLVVEQTSGAGASPLAVRPLEAGGVALAVRIEWR